MSSIKIVIPARYGSSRLEGKPLLEIIRKPIFWHVYQRCLEAGFDEQSIVLATDDERIYQKAQDLGLSVVMTSECHESGTDRINEVASKMEWSSADVVINVQGDEPLIPAALINLVASFAVSNPQFDISTAVTPIDCFDSFQNPNVVKAILGENQQALYFTRSPAPFNRDNSIDTSLAFRHVGIYAYRVNALKQFCSYSESALEKYEKLEQLRALSNGMSIGACVYNGSLPHGVDTLEDFQAIKNKMESVQ